MYDSRRRRRRYGTRDLKKRENASQRKSRPKERERERESEYERVLFFFVVVWPPLNSFYAPLERKTEEKMCAKTESAFGEISRNFRL
jgi:hypothetical protein